MKYYEFGNLADFIRLNPDILKNHPNRIAKFMRNMLKALYLIHYQNVCHRDIKPDNIFVGTYNNGS